MKVLRETISQFSIGQLKYFTSVLSTFPIKKRQNKRQITTTIAEELMNRSYNVEEFEKQMIDLLGSDKKLIQKFRNDYKLNKVDKLDS